MVGHGGSSAGSYLADPTSPIPSQCASIVTLRVNSTVRVKLLRGSWFCVLALAVFLAFNAVINNVFSHIGFAADMSLGGIATIYYFFVCQTSALHSGQVRGICGDYNGDVLREMTGPKKQLYSKPEQFVLSYVVPSDRCDVQELKQRYNINEQGKGQSGSYV